MEDSVEYSKFEHLEHAWQTDELGAIVEETGGASAGDKAGEGRGLTSANEGTRTLSLFGRLLSEMNIF